MDDRVGAAQGGVHGLRVTQVTEGDLGTEAAQRLGPQPRPTDRRVKVVVLSSGGQQLRARLLEHVYRPPAALSALSHTDLRALWRVAGRLREPPREPLDE